MISPAASAGLSREKGTAIFSASEKKAVPFFMLASMQSATASHTRRDIGPVHSANAAGSRPGIQASAINPSSDSGTGLAPARITQ